MIMKDYKHRDGMKEERMVSESTATSWAMFGVFSWIFLFYMMDKFY